MPTAPKRLGTPASGVKRLEYRGNANARGYTYQWSKVAKRAKQRDMGLCQPCMRAGLTVTMDVVDHIIPVHVRPDLRLCIENTESQCHACHKAKTDRDNVMYGSREATCLSVAQRENRERANGGQ